jgi:hypothetical protein
MTSYASFVRVLRNFVRAVISVSTSLFSFRGLSTLDIGLFHSCGFGLGLGPPTKLRNQELTGLMPIQHLLAHSFWVTLTVADNLNDELGDHGNDRIAAIGELQFE